MSIRKRLFLFLLLIFFHNFFHQSSNSKTHYFLLSLKCKTRRLILNFMYVRLCHYLHFVFILSIQAVVIVVSLVGRLFLQQNNNRIQSPTGGRLPILFSTNQGMNYDD